MDAAKILKACEEIAARVQGCYNEDRPIQLHDVIKVRTMCDVIEREVQVTRCEKCKHAHRTGVKDVYFCDVFECECTHDFFCKEGAI